MASAVFDQLKTIKQYNIEQGRTVHRITVEQQHGDTGTIIGLSNTKGRKRTKKQPCLIFYSCPSFYFFSKQLIIKRSRKFSTMLVFFQNNREPNGMEMIAREIF
jgi:hypothetical protein